MKNRKPTKRQLEAYVFITDFMEKNGYPPSGKEVATGLGITLRPAQKLINALYLKGLIIKIPRSARGIALP